MSIKYKRPLVVVNPNSAGGKTGKNYAQSLKILEESTLFEKIDVFKSLSKESTIEKVVEVHNGGNDYDMLISLGGDGSISTICNGLMNVDLKKRLPILPLPSGTGNSLLLDFHVKNIYDALNNFKKNEIKLLDVLLMEEINGNFKWHCINLIGLGFISDVVLHTVNKFNSFGAIKYMLGTFCALKEFKPYKTKILYNGKKEVFETDKAYFITVSNSKYSGGNIKVAPDALYDDGLLDIMILHDLGRLKYLRGFMRAFSGKHVHEKECKYFKAKDVEVYLEPGSLLMPDGELEGTSPINVKVLPREIKILL